MRVLAFCLILFQSCLGLAAEVEDHKTFTTHDGYTLNGLIRYPSNMTAKYPAVLLVHGMGPFDRNSYLSGRLSADGKPNKPFESIAQALSAHGIISFRYDKRGITHNPNGGAPTVDDKIYYAATLEDLIADAKAALAILYSDQNVDQGKLVILGISQGTLIAPQVAKESGVVSALVLQSSIGEAGNATKIAQLRIPTFLQHGQVDMLTPVAEARRIEHAIRNAGSTTYRLTIYRGLGHGFSPNVNGLPTLGPIDRNVVRDIPAWINELFH
jgi:dienelactone hydrolase